MRRATLERDIDGALKQLCAEELKELQPEVGFAIQYALQGGGKQLRGRLLLASYDAVAEANGNTKPSRDVSFLAAAVEIIHAYSLAHDDLPCMDDDDFRRGRPSLHRQFGVKAAATAGVAMVPLAVLAVTRASKALQLPNETRHTIVKVLMRASGASGMIGGQLLDLNAEALERPATGIARTVGVSLPELEGIHKAKTGALIAASTQIGAIAAGATGQISDTFYDFGALLGHAFQIVDDVLDVTSTSEQLGKTAGSDVKLGKSTYPALLGVEGARKRAEALVSEACTILKSRDVWGGRGGRGGHNLLTNELNTIAQFIMNREF